MDENVFRINIIKIGILMYERKFIFLKINDESIWYNV